MTETKQRERSKFITFHPSYTYEEFIEGITVKVADGEDGEDVQAVRYTVKDGIFKQFCAEALADAIGYNGTPKWRDAYAAYCRSMESGLAITDAAPYVLIIDEINRGDISKVFGELITLIEADKRLPFEPEAFAKRYKAVLPTTGDEFGVPANLYIIGTMNTADRSIALLDVALRRRFGFVEMNPDFAELQTMFKDDELVRASIAAVIRLNERICSQDFAIGRDRQIGHSYFWRLVDGGKPLADASAKRAKLHTIWRYDILPLLEEYCYSDYGAVRRLLFGDESGGKDFIDDMAGIKLQPGQLEAFVSSVATTSRPVEAAEPAEEPKEATKN